MPAKLLIADDSTTIQKVFERTFPPEEFTLSFANNGEEALAKARMEKPNVIIADIDMPAKNGFEVCEELKKDPALKSTPVLLLIGILDDFDEDESRRVGADGFIVKPFETNAAISKVREALAKGVSALPTGATGVPAGGGAEEILDLTDIAQEPTTTPPPKKKGAEDILDLTDIIEEPATKPAPPQEKAEEIMELDDIIEEPITTPPLEKATEDIFELPDIAEGAPATPQPPLQEKQEESDFVLQTSLRELEEELKAEFPEKKAEGKEELSLQEEESVSLDLDLPLDELESEPQVKDADWTGLFGELGEEPGQETKNERIGTILDESTTELEKIEDLTQRKDEEATKEEEFAEKFAEDFEPVFEPDEDLQPIDTLEKDLKMTLAEDKEDLAEKVASTVGHELKEVVEKVIKDKVPELVRQEIDRLKKE